MKLLLDTHVFLWYISADRKLPATFAAAIQDPTNDVYLSVVSIWEAVIKYGLGKLPLPASPAVYLQHQRIAHQIASQSLNESTMLYLPGLSLLHRDPFDRLLVAQALDLGMMIATVDPAISAYPVPLLPAA